MLLVLIRTKMSSTIPKNINFEFIGIFFQIDPINQKDYKQIKTSLAALQIRLLHPCRMKRASRIVYGII